MVLSVISMLSYRGALTSITEREQNAVLADARQAASILPLNTGTSTSLSRALPPSSNGALLDIHGSARVSVGVQPLGNLFAPLDGAPTEALAAGPNEHTQGRVVAWLPLRNGLILRVDRERLSLAAEWTRWRRLVIVITLAVGALGTLLLLYLRRLFAPIDNLLETARQLEDQDFGDDGPAEEDDEIEYLVYRFERAMEALREQRERSRDSTAALNANPQAQLAGQLSTLQQTFSRLESGMALVDLDSTVLAINRAGSEILGLRTSDAAATVPLPVHLADLLQCHPQLLKLLQEAVANNQPLRRQECSIQVPTLPVDERCFGSESTDSGAADGVSREPPPDLSRRDLGLTLSPLTWDDGTPRGWIVLFADLTDARQKADRERLSTSLDQLAELSAGLAHELRNSLASMQGYAALLERADLPPTAAADTHELQREIGQLHRIVEDFLSFARPGTSHLENVDLLRLAHRAASDPALGQAAIKVVTEPASLSEVFAGDDLDTSSCTVHGDEQLLHRLLRNLLLNAVRAQRDASVEEPVIVRIAHDPQAGARGEPKLALHVEDRGKGLSNTARKTLFVPFATDSAGGSGLGLAVARRIADLHGATLEIHNRRRSGVRASVIFRKLSLSPPTTSDSPSDQP